MAPTLTAARRAAAAVRTLLELTAAPPNARQRAALEAFPGWGPAATLFDPQPSDAWAELADELDDVAGGSAMLAAAHVVDTSFFTPPTLIDHIYGVLRAAGFVGGTVLDLGCGSGRFLRHAPADIPIAYTGVDADPISAQIAAALHPESHIITGELQSVSLPHKRFDAAIGNVPFSSANVHDGAISFYGPLHEYFLLRAVSAVKPGGYVVVVTSRHTLDAKHGLSATVRAHADLLAAVRLPSGYFNGEGTDVIADVLVLRVRENDQDPRHGWHPGSVLTVERSGIIAGRYCRAWVSSFWDHHPQCVAGQLRLTGFDRNALAVDTDYPVAAVAAAFTAVHPMLVSYPHQAVLPTDLTGVAFTDVEGRKEGSLHVVAGQVVRVVDAELHPLTRPSAELRMLIELRDAALTLVSVEADWDTPDAAVEPLRTTCRDSYTAYVQRFGPLNRGMVTEGKIDPETSTPKLGWKVPTLGGFRADPDAAIVLALEHFDQDSGQCSPAPILTRRVNRRPQPVHRAATAGEALAISMGEGRGLDLARVAGLLGLHDTDAAFTALHDLVYRDPVDGRPVIARNYLAGNVRLKLRDAAAAAAVDEQYTRNVVALRAVQPTWLGRDEIRIEMGSPWVAAGDVADFCHEVFGHRASVEHIAPLAAWEVQGVRYRLSDQAKIAYCTQRKDAFELLQAGLNGAAPIVYDEVYDERTRTTRRIRNADQTEAAEQKLAAIGDRFSIWVWENPTREQRIVDRYNHAMNSHVLRRHDGSHLTFPGLAEGIDLWPWQRDFVDQAVSSPTAFAAFEVGLGKTLTAITLAMTLRQFGLSNRPAYVVPNHLIEFVTRQCYQSWPAGRFLIVSRADLHADARRRFGVRCATGDWDLVIMTHETFSAIPVPADVERSWLDDQLAELESYTRTAGYTGKRIAAAVRSLQGRIQQLRHDTNDDDALTWNVLGIDHLSVDEVDRFRRLPVTTRADGFSLGSSKRAVDLLLKMSMLRRANPHRPHAAFFTGTPFTNTLAEAHVWKQFLAPAQLAESGLSHFDAWAAQFVRYEVLVEVAPDGGGFRSRRRPSVIQNIPELRSMLGGFMSMVRADSTGLKRPTPVRHNVVVQPSETTHDFMAALVTRADALRARRVGVDVDNMLLICGDGRKVALDPNLVGCTEDAPKLEAVADTVAGIYHRTRAVTYPGSVTPGAFQLVLCDLGTPKPGDNQSYGRIRAALIARGVTADQIRFIHDATEPKAREALFAGCRSGAIAVLIGSTPKVGIGTNIQARLHSLHHVDPTWTASAWEQRNGRAIRTGNHHERVDIYSYVCEGTFDAYMFGIVERKSRGFEQLYRGDSEAREIEDLGDGTLSFAELKAAAAGNTLLLRQHELATRIRKLRLAHVTVQQNVRAMILQATQAEETAQMLNTRAERLAAFSQHRERMTPMDLSHTASAVCDPRGLREHPHHRWSEYHVSVGFCTLDSGHQLRLSFGAGRTQLWSQILPPKVRRRGAGAVHAWADAVVGDWLDGLDGEIADTRRRALAGEQRAVQARAAAATTDTSEPPDLVAARCELHAVDRAIRDELVNQGQTPTAA